MGRVCSSPQCVLELFGGLYVVGCFQFRFSFGKCVLITHNHSILLYTTLVVCRGTSGVIDLAGWLKVHGIRTAIVTRNTAATVEHLHAALWEPAGLERFSPAIARDDPFPPKPDPAALVEIARRWDIPLSAEILMVGDSASNDVAFGKVPWVHIPRQVSSIRDAVLLYDFSTQFHRGQS